MKPLNSDGNPANELHAGSWIGVDLDGTLAHYDGWKGVEHIGEPIPAMVERVKRWCAEGKEVRIFTARVGPRQTKNDISDARCAIADWCWKHLGFELEVTHEKDLKMYELWDDRSVCVERNTGRILGRNPSDT
jgi:hypothetical protein